ncbi:hypothetical protein BD770DRAFT_400979 [Pilaira anomala]|nr:hypothetical protein BD770DRAFT_400979 [Pilaira anomala]
MWICGYVDTWIRRYVNMWICGYVDIKCKYSFVSMYSGIESLPCRLYLRLGKKKFRLLWP